MGLVKDYINLFVHLLCLIILLVRRPPLSLPRLNIMEQYKRREVPLDVLLAVALLSNKATVSTLMRTCRLLYREGAKYLVREVVLEKDSQLPSFFEFMKAGADSYRWLFIRSLQLNVERINLTPDVAELLHQIFHELFLHSRLQSLCINDEHSGAEALLSSHDGIAKSIAALRTLRDVNLECCGPRTAKMLRSMSSLVSARVTFDDVWMRDEEDDDDLLYKDFTRLFLQSQSSLEKVVVCYPGETFPGGPVYPRLTSLYIDTPSCLPEITHYIHSFPNLSSLTTYDENATTAFADMPSEREHNMRQHKETCSWSSLADYEGHIRMLYCFGLTCHIARLQTLADGPREIAMLLEVLPDVRPDVLVLDSISNGREVIEETFVTALCEPRTPPLSSLSLNIQPCCGEDLDGVALLETLVRIAQSLKLTVLNVMFQWHTGYCCSACSNGTLSDQLFCPTRFLDPMDIDAFARRLKDSASTLETVSVALNGLRTTFRRSTIGTRL
ncbi:hypothetical protein C8Q74DRAFT_1297514 [Fomes fomentarius]|nr:hypothetical protein C8Q74DRAFT_1297514 [Fomes fomentarius]